MNKYIYHFVDGTSQAVEVTNEQYTMLFKEDMNEKRQEWVAEKHDLSLDYFHDKGLEFSEDTDDTLQCLIKKENKEDFEKILTSRLKPKQIKLVKMLIYEEYSQTDIGMLWGVSRQAIQKQVRTIRKKIGNIF